jgi:hypothetical protein
VLIALVIVSVGLLGMAGTSALALRTTTTAARERAALGRLELRLATLAAGGCVLSTTGVLGDLDVGIRERWSLSAPSRGVALADVSAEWRDGGAVRSVALRSAILC